MFLESKKCKMFESNNLQIGDLIYYKLFLLEYNKEKKVYGIILNKLIKNEILHYKVLFFNHNLIYYKKNLIPFFWCHKVEKINEEWFNNR